MPRVRKLEPEEVQELQHGRMGVRKQIEREYDAIMSEYTIGDHGKAELEADEKRNTVKNRLTAAATRLQLQLKFRRNRGRTLFFEVVARETPKVAASTPTKPVAVPVPPPPAVIEAPAPKRRGRKPKNVIA
jgi:hypothetical protein